jgi:hypothetical protein
MNFKDLQFSLGKLSSDVKSHMAKKNPLYKNDTKVLSVWIFQERNDLATMRTLAYRRGETNTSFREWTTNGHEQWNEDDEYTDLQVKTIYFIKGTRLSLISLSLCFFFFLCIHTHRILVINWRLCFQEQMKLSNNIQVK